MIAFILLFTIPFIATAEKCIDKYDENGKIIESSWQDGNGDYIAGPEGWSIIRYAYKGENTIEQYFDTKGQPYLLDGGYYAKRVQRERSGRVLEIEYLDQNGKRMLNREGYGLIRMTYYKFGEVKSVTYYGLDKKAVMVPTLGYSSLLYEYNGTVLKKMTFRDENQKPVDGRNGYAIMNKLLNKQFLVERIRYLHADESAATGPDGWSRCIKKWDDKGRLISIQYEDENEMPTNRGSVYLWEGYEYPGNNTIRITRYNSNNEAVTDIAGVATIEQETKDGRVCKERFFDKEGKQIQNELGVGEIIYSYDQLGSLEKVSYLDPEGKPVLCSKGYAGYRDVKDEDGATVSRTYFGTDGTPVIIDSGYCEIRYLYDETKTLIATRYYDINGTQLNGQ